MTTNLGTRNITRSATTGFNVGGNTQTSYERMKESVTSELKENFRPEFLNRLDDIIVFRQLTEPQVRQIVDLDLKKLNDRMFDRHIELELTDAAKDALAVKGFDPLLGARPLRRVIQNQIEDEVAEGILEGRLHDNERISIDAKGEGKDATFEFVGIPFAADGTVAQDGAQGADGTDGVATSGDDSQLVSEPVSDAEDGASTDTSSSASVAESNDNAD